MTKIDHQLDDLLLPYNFDLSIFDQIDNPELISHIERLMREKKLRMVRKYNPNHP